MIFVSYSYDVAQICLSGHVITHRAKACHYETKKFCTTCGEATITTCSNCNSSINGYNSNDSWSKMDVKYYVRPNYCHECGSPYPWTENAMHQSLLVIEEDQNLTSDEITKMKQSITNLVKGKESPSRFKSFLQMVTAGTAQTLRDILVNILSEAISKSIWS